MGAAPIQPGEPAVFHGAGGIELVTHRWAPDGEAAARAVVAIVHGLVEHHGRYGAVVSAMAWTNAHAWQLPLLVVHGTGDRIMDPAGSRAFAADWLECHLPGGAPPPSDRR